MSSRDSLRTEDLRRRCSWRLALSSPSCCPLGYELVNPWTVSLLRPRTRSRSAEASGSRETTADVDLAPTDTLRGRAVRAARWRPRQAASMLGDSELFGDHATPNALLRLKWVDLHEHTVYHRARPGLDRPGGIGEDVSPTSAAIPRSQRSLAAVVAETPGGAVCRPHSPTQRQTGADSPRMVGPLLDVASGLRADGRHVALAYTEVSPWTAPLFFIPALAAQGSSACISKTRLLDEQVRLAEDLSSANATLRRRTSRSPPHSSQPRGE